MRILGLDPGEKRIGVAITDPLGLTAQGIDVITYDKIDEAVEKLKMICQKYEVETIVVGNPLNMNGTAGTASEQAANFADILRNELGLPVVMIDERLTSAGAERTLISGGVSRKNRKKFRDKIAAVLILETYLSSRS
ncbi:MAG: Holliday junction resolvase RuvX [Bacillota bacterium]|nr:Holliday junction resolvase RuvX [Bacillota bacterium]